MKPSNSSDKNLKIGATFTPLKWADFAVEKFGLFEKWLAGKSIFDPTFGGGNLIFSLIQSGVNKGYKPKELPIENLYGIELNSDFFATIFNEAKEKFDVDM